MQSTVYVGLALALGALAVWASENFFWMIPPPGITVPDFTMTVIAYAIACAVALSAVIWTGVGGLPAAFLGGAVMGYMAEGVIVGTIYQLEAFPFFLVFTPLAWHALLSGGLILGVGRLGARLGPLRMALIWAGRRIWNRFGERKVYDPSGLAHMTLEKGDVESRAVEDRAVLVAHRDDGHALSQCRSNQPTHHCYLPAPNSVPNNSAEPVVTTAVPDFGPIARIACSRSSSRNCVNSCSVSTPGRW